MKNHESYVYYAKGLKSSLKVNSEKRLESLNESWNQAENVEI